MRTGSLTREESKSITRRRLIEAALRLLAAEGGGRALTASKVAREAGVAQPTFYVHFRDRDDLLRAVGALRIGDLRSGLKQTLARIDLTKLASGDQDEALRDAFRLSLRTIVEQPTLYRVYVRERLHGDSPLGDHCRRLAAELRTDLLESLRAWAAWTGRAPGDDELGLIADGITGLTETIGLAYLDGCYADLEQVVDVLVRFTRGALA